MATKWKFWSVDSFFPQSSGHRPDGLVGSESPGGERDLFIRPKIREIELIGTGDHHRWFTPS